MLDTTTFIGLDVHARSIKAVSLDVMTGEVRCATFGYDAGAVAGWVRSVDPRARCVYESAKGVRRLVERREALLARGVHGNKANVATARELACWVWAVGLMAEEA